MPHRRTGLLLRALFAVFALLLLAVVAFSIYADQQATMRRAAERSGDLAASLAAHVELRLAEIDDVLREAGAGANGERDAAARAYTELERRMPGVRATFVRRGGNIEVEPASMAEAVKADLAKMSIADTSLRGDVRIGVPLAAKGKSGALLPVWRNTRSGNAVLAVGVLLDQPWFAQVHQQLRLGDGMVSLLLSSEDVLLARQPPREFDSVTTNGDYAAFTRMRAAARDGHIRGRGPSDGVDRLYSFQRLDRFPATVVVGMKVDNALSNWHLRTRHLLLVVVMTAIGLGWMTVVMLRRFEQIGQARQAARMSELRLRSATSAMAEGFLLQGEDGRILEWNEAALQILGQTPTQLSGRSTLDGKWRVIDEHGNPLDVEAYPAVQTLRTGQAQTGRIVGIVDDVRDLRWIRINTAPILDETSGNVVMVSVAFLDITEQRRSEARLADSNTELEMRVAQRTQALQRANEDLETFAYTLAHDLRAPTRHIAGFSAQLYKMLGDTVEPRARRWLQLIQESAERQARLVEELLAYTGIGAQPVKSEPVDMIALARVVRDQVTTEWPALQIDWVIGDLPELVSDPVILREVLYNLCANAVKFSQTRDRPRVEIGVIRQAEGGPIYFVADNGVGFDQALESHLFKLFERLHADQAFAGTGMGLAIVRRLLAKIGGSIWAWGRVDEGATFYFNFDPEVGNIADTEDNHAQQ